MSGLDAATFDALVEQAASLVPRLEERGLTLGTCESLTGGLLAAVLTSVPGASRVYRGSVVTYASDLKASLVGVDAEHIAEHGVINPETAAQMALGARELLGTSLALACTGVAGPEPQDGQPPGTVWVALAGPNKGQVRVEHLPLDGDRTQIRCDTCGALLDAVHELLGNSPGESGT